VDFSIDDIVNEILQKRQKKTVDTAAESANATTETKEEVATEDETAKAETRDENVEKEWKVEWRIEKETEKGEEKEPPELKETIAVTERPKEIREPSIEPVIKPVVKPKEEENKKFPATETAEKVEPEREVAAKESVENGSAEREESVRIPSLIIQPKEEEKNKFNPFYEEEEEENVDVPPFVDRPLKGEDELEALLGEAYVKFKNRVIEKIGREAYNRARRYAQQKRENIISVLASNRLLDPYEIYEIWKEIVYELEIPKIYLFPKSKFVDVKIVDGETKFYWNEREVFPNYALEIPVQKVKEGIVLALLPIDEYKALKTTAEIQQAKKQDIKVIDFETILRKALEMKASDIHIIPKESGFITFFRVNKELVEIKEFFMSKDEWKVFAQVLFNEVAKYTVGQFKTDDFRVVNEGRIDYPELGVTVRFEYIPDGYSLKYGEIVCRILKKKLIKASEPLKKRLLKLGYEEADAEVFERVASLEGGLAIFSGKTNSGKSTLIAEILASIPITRKVETIEDPIEYVHANPNIVQHQVYVPPEEKDKLGPVEYVKAFKRADSDVVLVGEWRNYEGLSEAMVEQAQAGQLIFTTLHIVSAFDVYEALHTAFKVPYEISAQLILFSFNQSLVPKLCPHCSDEVEIRFTEKELRFSKQLTAQDVDRLLSISVRGRKRNPEKAKKCPYCKGRGVIGLVPLYEYFVPDEEIRNRIIKEGAEFTPLKLKEYVINAGYIEKGLAKLKVDSYLKALEKGLVEKEVLFKI